MSPIVRLLLPILLPAARAALKVALEAAVAELQKELAERAQAEIPPTQAVVTGPAL